MRPLIEAIVTDLDGVRFMAINLFDENGQHADQIVKPAEEDDDAVLEIVALFATHDLSSADVYTDNEAVFKAFLPMAGYNAKFVLPTDLTPLYDVLSPYSSIYPLIREMWLPDKEVEEARLLSWWQRLFIWIKRRLRK